MTDDDLLRMWTSGAGRHYEIPLLNTLRTIARAAAAGEREACADLIKDKAERYHAASERTKDADVREMFLDMACAADECEYSILSRSAAGGQGGGGGSNG